MPWAEQNRCRALLKASVISPNKVGDAIRCPRWRKNACDFARYVAQLCQRNWREGGQGALTTRLSRAASTTSVVTVARPLMVSTRSIWANSRWMSRKFPPVTRAMVENGGIHGVIHRRVQPQLHPWLSCALACSQHHEAQPTWPA